MQIENITLPPIRLKDLDGHPGFRFEGPGGDRFKRETIILLDQLSKRNIIKAQIATNLVPVRQICSSRISLDESVEICSVSAARKLENATQLLFSVCTLGEGIAQEIYDLQMAGKQLRAVLLDSLAGYSLIQLANRMEQKADRVARNLGILASGRTNPGDSGFDLSEQPKILALAGAEQIGVSLTSGQMMTPRFSMTAVFGIGENVEKTHSDQMCEDCNARMRCPHASYKVPGRHTDPVGVRL